MPDHDPFYRELEQRLSAYESRIADAEPPNPHATPLGRRTALAAILSPAAIAGVLLAAFLLGRPDQPVGEASPSSSATPVATSTLTPRPSVVPTMAPTTQPTEGQPFSGVEPYEPEEVVVRLLQTSGVGPAVPTVSVFADGRVVTYDSFHGTIQERRLGADGIVDLVERLTATGLFDTSASYGIELRPGSTAPHTEFPVDIFIIATEAGDVEVLSVPWVDPSWMEPAPKREALAAVAQDILDLEWLPSGAWVLHEPSAYQAPAYLLFIGMFNHVEPPSPGAPTIADFIWPLSEPPDVIGDPFQSADGVQSVVNRCTVLSTPAGLALIESFGALLGRDADDQFVVGADAAWPERDADITFRLRKLLPDERPTCDRKSLPPVVGDG